MRASISPASRFDFSVEETAALGVTFFLIGQWQGIVPNENVAWGWVLRISRNAVKRTESDGDAAQSVFFPLQMLLMARRPANFQTIQKLPAFSGFGQESLCRLCSALRQAGVDGFTKEWRAIYTPERAANIPPNEIVRHEEGDGDSKATAVLLGTAEPRLMVAAEYWYLSFLFGRQEQQWSFRMQTMLKRDENGKMYDLIDIALADGNRRSVYFDISALPH